MSRFTKVLAAFAALSAIGLTACEENDRIVDIDIGDEDLFDSDDIVEIDTPDGEIEIEEDGDIDINN